MVMLVMLGTTLLYDYEQHIHKAFAEYASSNVPTFVNNVTFIQYLDENTALEQVRNGNLDLYYYRISSDRIENVQLRRNLQVFESVGGSYSVLVNPADTLNLGSENDTIPITPETLTSQPPTKFNPFSFQEVRFALNYLIDRKLIVNELLSGYGTVMFSNYGPYDPDYVSIIEQLESFNFEYNPTLANKIITDVLLKNGASKSSVDSEEKSRWFFNDSPIQITIFIRSDDPVRKAIGEILASELDSIGFQVKKDFGDLNKAFVIVYGSDPADLKWNLYTEGWGGRSAFVRYDPIGLGQMYSPWFSNMPGFNDPTYWNYKNQYLDQITQRIYTGNFTSEQERIKLIQNATYEGVKESVRIFLASKTDQYIANEKVKGIINDFGAGVPSRFTPINAKIDSDDTLLVGVKQIYQGAWNPVMGLNDVYSTHIWNTIYDPIIFKHPYTGKSIPIRTTWNVTTVGPYDKLDVPDDAILWNTMTQRWENIPSNTQSTSKVTFDLKFSRWHNGEFMDINDVMYYLYFILEWGSAKQRDDDKTYDSEFTPRFTQTVNTIKGIRVLDDDTIQVYVDYWHFDTAEIADWASVWSVMPWEIYAAMEKSVIDGKASFSRSGSVSKNVNWLSLLVPRDASLIASNLQEYRDTGYIPTAFSSNIGGIKADEQYVFSRYDRTIKWIEEKNHAVISNGPFYLQSYSPESRTIKIQAFRDESYPFDKGHWSEFENIRFPVITSVDLPNVVLFGKETVIPIKTKYSDRLYYFVTNADGKQIQSGIEDIKNDTFVLVFDSNTTSQLSLGANDLKLFVVSNDVLRPDIYLTSFLVLNDDYNKSLDKIINLGDVNESSSTRNGNNSIVDNVDVMNDTLVFGLVIISLIIVLVMMIIKKYKR